MTAPGRRRPRPPRPFDLTTRSPPGLPARPRRLPVRGVLGVLAVLSAAAGACGGDGAPGDEAWSRPAEPAGAHDSVALTDAEGRRVRLSGPPERIVSLVPAASRVLLELGAGDRLVGRTEHDTLAALAPLPSVGGGLHPSLEVLVGLKPDLVIRFAGETDRETPTRLERAGIAHLSVAPERIADVREMIGQLGRIVGRAGAADSLVASMDAALAGVRARVAGRPPVRTAWVMSGSPPWVSGPGTFIDELITLAGGINVFEDLGRPWAAVSPESLVGRRPEVLLAPEGTALDPRIAGEVPVRTVSPWVQLPGPDLPEAALQVARALHPGAFR